MNARMTSISSHCETARQHLDKTVRSLAELDTLEQHNTHLSGLDRAAFEATVAHPLEVVIARDSQIAVIFSALAAEAYINDYAARRLSPAFVKAHIEKLDLQSKWVLVPQLITGHRFPKERHAFALLRELVRARNLLVHPKSVQVVIEGIEIGQPRVNQAAQSHSDFMDSLPDLARHAVQALGQLAKIIEELDPQECASVMLCGARDSNALARDGEKDL